MGEKLTPNRHMNRISRWKSGAILATSALLFLVSCEDQIPGKKVTEPLKLEDGTEISVAKLESGREKYMLYCRACHGEEGDGRGPAGIGLRPPPRNFKEGVFKFGGVPAGELPTDAQLKRVIKNGLQGTAMLPWAVPDQDLDEIVQYIKTFSEVWQEDEIGEEIEIGEDPWKGKATAAVAQGKLIYHGLAQCQKCHPSYASKQEIWDAVAKIQGEGSTSAFREGMYFPEAKYSEAYGHKLLPPDFTRHLIKAGQTPRDLFLTIGAGIGGTAMPMWKGSIEDKDIWAIAYYVNDLAKKYDDPQMIAMRKKMLEQPEFVPPNQAEQPGEASAN